MKAQPIQIQIAPSAERADRSRQQHLEEVVASFLDGDGSDRAGDWEKVVANHPDLAEELAGFFENHAWMKKLASSQQRSDSSFSHSARDAFSSCDRACSDSSCDRACSESNTDGLAEPTSDLGNTGTWCKPGVSLPCRYGDYELTEEIGRGGMGVVYRARQLSLNRIVAVKTVHAGLVQEGSAIQRFRVEAEAAAKLQHTHIVQVYEIGEHEGQPFFSMQYVEGRNLLQTLHQAPLAPKRAARYVRQISLAVAHAHEHGVLHRDLKPSNVLIDSHDEPRVMDFGLAKQLESSVDITLSGQLLGTPPYMSPEQAGAPGTEVGPASDVYSLGAVLYELLTGQPPFRGATPLETLRQVRECDPRLPRTLNPHVPRDLEMICLKCLEKDARHRYSTAHDLATDLERYLAGEPISLSSLGLFERLARRLERGSWEVELNTWRQILRHFAWIVLLAHLVLFGLDLRWRPAPWYAFALVRSTEYIALILVLWLLRREWYPPRSSPARQLFVFWLAYVIGSTVLHVVHPFEGRALYPHCAVLAGLGFIMMGSAFWGYCYLIGAAFWVLAILIAWLPSFDPLLFGIVWSGSLLALAQRMRKLSLEL